MVGLGRLELPTSRLSGVRSNHLSYRPERGAGIQMRALPRAKTSGHLTSNSSSDRKRNEDGDVPHFNVTITKLVGLCSEDFLWMVRH